MQKPPYPPPLSGLTDTSPSTRPAPTTSHTWLVNDDGPPSASSPYFAPFVAALHQAGHSTVVVIPDRPLSWIAKAHSVGKTITSTSWCPHAVLAAAAATADASTASLLQAASAISNGTANGTLNATHTSFAATKVDIGVHTMTDSPTDNEAAKWTSCPFPNCAGVHDPTHHWLITDGPPAACTQLGLFHAGPRSSARPQEPRLTSTASSHDRHQPYFDLVISGPNHGRNASTIYNLSSGTVGGAMEAALSRHRAVALSFGSKEAQPAARIAAVARRAAALVGELVATWHPGVELYNVNVPMRDDIEACAVRFTRPSRTYWTRGGLFTEVDREEKAMHLSRRQRQFRWTPNLSEVSKTEADAPEGEDLWALANQVISVTPLRANFEVVDIDAFGV